MGMGSVSPVQAPPVQIKVRRDGPVAPVPVVHDQAVINQQIDDCLGCTSTEYIWPDRKYRPRPDLKWFSTNWGTTLVPSAAEQLIIDELEKYNIKWEREISFAGLLLSTGGWARYDFLLPDHNIVIEYHGRCWHTTSDRTTVDTIKEQFCIDNHINLVTYKSQDYYHIPARIKKLMGQIGVR